jgi:hypothetical protein
LLPNTKHLNILQSIRWENPSCSKSVPGSAQGKN